VIVPPVPFSNVSGDWSVPLMRDAYTRLSADLKLILYDGRGTSASGRSVEDLSLAALTGNLRAVLDDAGLERAALLAIYLAVGPAIRLAAETPDRVSHLVLFGAAPDGSKMLDRPGTRALLGLIDSDWELFTQTAALDWMGWGAGEDGRLVAESFRRATTPPIARAALAAFASTDLRPSLPAVQAETLVLHRRGNTQLPLEVSASLAAALPRGRLHILEGSSATLLFEDPVGITELITSFLRPDRGVPPRAAAGRGTDEALTAREVEVLTLIAAGDSNGQIAQRLGISVHTVERHAANIYRKIDARGRADATAWALRHGLG
jgi:DNA-binding CsgD family transcriptional regulator/pimeloyl-ACP methyl ester carboxylesterase